MPQIFSQREKHTGRLVVGRKKQVYDSTDDTLKHIRRVQEILLTFQSELTKRAIHHDSTKLTPPEKPIFDKATPRLKSSTYGSRQYEKMLKELAPALKHHYSCHRHHPENHPRGVADMTLVDLVELLADWKSASERHDNGSLALSIEQGRKRFKLDEVSVTMILENTRSSFGWN